MQEQGNQIRTARTEIYLQTFGPEDEDGYRRQTDVYQIPGNRDDWKFWYGVVRDRTGRDGLILMYRATCDVDRNLVSVSATPWRIR